jgi:hypothetical protein
MSLVWLVCINREIFRLHSVLIIWLLISGPFLISQEAPFLLLLICYLPAQVLAVSIPAVILWQAGKRHPAEQVRQPEGIMSKLFFRNQSQLHFENTKNLR